MSDVEPTYHDQEDVIGFCAEMAEGINGVTLTWKSYGDRGLTARGGKGIYRIVEGHTHWILSIQPTFTRGMVDKGKFGDCREAQLAAEDYENNGEPILPLQIGTSDLGSASSSGRIDEGTRGDVA